MRKIAFILVFTILLFGVNILIYKVIPDSIWRYLLIGIAFSTIILTSQTLSKKWFLNK